MARVLKRPRPIAAGIIVLAAMMLVAAAACGSSDEPDATAAVQPSPTATTAFPSPTPTATLGLQTAVAATATARVNLIPTIAGDPPIITSLILDLQPRGVALDRIDITNSTDQSTELGGCLSAPYRSFQLPAGGRLHMFLYDNAQAAAAAAATVPVDGNCKPIIWSLDTNYFLFNQIIIFTASNDRAVYQALTDLAGPAFACGVGLGGPTTCEQGKR